MSYHPINLFLRFALEICAWISMGVYGWHLSNKPLSYLLMIGLPFISMLIWGTFNVPDDPSRSGKAPVVVRGIIRLMIELITFGIGAWSLFSLGHNEFAIAFSILTSLHYLLSGQRIKWLLAR